MKSEVEIKKMLEKLRTIELAIHPSVIKFGEWILEEGDQKEVKIWEEIMNGIIESVERNKYDFSKKRLESK